VDIYRTKHRNGICRITITLFSNVAENEKIGGASYKLLIVTIVLWHIQVKPSVMWYIQMRMCPQEREGKRRQQ
jgi:hypothetical protein